jgi:hypothetical protein
MKVIVPYNQFLLLFLIILFQEFYCWIIRKKEFDFQNLTLYLWEHHQKISFPFLRFNFYLESRVSTKDRIIPKLKILAS